jgi:hypothetical protein
MSLQKAATSLDANSAHGDTELSGVEAMAVAPKARNAYPMTIVLSPVSADQLRVILFVTGEPSPDSYVLVF